MQEIEIDPVGLEPPQTSFTSGYGASTRGVLWQHLGHDEAFVPASFDGLSDDLIDAEPKRSDLLFSRPYAFTHAPGALPELRNPFTRGKRYGGLVER
jgi:hypothetical protein